MTSNLPATTSVSIPAPLRPDVAKRLQHWTSDLKTPMGQGRFLPYGELPTDEQRSVLERRVLQIEAWCAPIAPQVLRTQLQGTLGMLKGPAMSEEEVEFELSMFQRVLADLPAFAIIAACNDFLHLRVGDGWKPKPPGEMRVVALRHLEIQRREKHQLETVLAAKSLPPNSKEDERARNMADFRRLLDDLDETNRIDKLRRGGMSGKELSEAQAQAKQLQACIEAGVPDTRPPVVFSPTLKQALENDDRIKGRQPRSYGLPDDRMSEEERVA